MWFKKAAEQGHQSAMVSLANKYKEGKGKNEEKKIRKKGEKKKIK